MAFWRRILTLYPILRTWVFARRHIGAGLIVAVASALYLYRLGYQSLWYDELFQHWAARFPLPQLVAQVAADGQTPPLSYIVTHFWLDVVSAIAPDLAIAHPEFFLRLPSVFFAVLLLCVIYRLALRLSDPFVALLVLCLCALNPLLLTYAQEGRAYSLALLLVALSFLCFERILRGTPQRWTWLLYGLVSVAALYTHYYTVWALLAQSLIFVWSRLRERDIRAVLRWIVVQMLIGLCFLPWVGIWLSVVSQTSAQLTVPPIDLAALVRQGFGWAGLGNMPVADHLTFQTTQDVLATFLCVSGLITVTLGTNVAIRKKQGQRWSLLLAWWICGMFGSALSGQIVKLPNAARYAIQGLLPLVFLIAISSVWLIAPQLDATGRGQHNRYIFRRRFGAILGVCVLGLWAASMFWSIRQYESNPDVAREDWRGILTTVATEAKPGDLILGFPYHHFEVAQDVYLRGVAWLPRAGGWSYDQSGALYLPGEHWGGYADFTSARTAPSSDLTGELAHIVQPYTRIWVVAYNDSTNTTILDWLATHYQAQPPRFFNPRQSLVLYRYDASVGK